MARTKNELSSLFQVTEVELVYRNKVSPKDRKPILSSTAAYDVLMSAWDINKIEIVEQFNILLLDTAGRCLGFSEVATGGISSCLVDPRIVFSTALTAKASSLVLAHNHPSGNLKPSAADIRLTEKLAEGGRLLEIKIFDHLIVTPSNYYSMNDNDMMP